MQTGLRDGLDAIGDKARYVSAAAVRLKGRLGHNDSESGIHSYAHTICTQSYSCHDSYTGRNISMMNFQLLLCSTAGLTI